MLWEEFLKPLSISQSAFAIRLGVSFPRLNEIIRQKRSGSQNFHRFRELARNAETPEA